MATGCRDETAARQILADLERKAELVRSGVITGTEEQVGKHHATALEGPFNASDEHLAAKGVTPIHRQDSVRYLRGLATQCTFNTLADFRREALERWLALRAGEDVSARSRDAYRNAVVAFCNRCVATHRLAGNPLAAVAKANENADRRRQRGAMTEAELQTLLAMARKRPLVEALSSERAGCQPVTTGPQCRGDWIRTSDLLNPINEVAGVKIAKASRFKAYKSYTSHILQ